MSTDRLSKPGNAPSDAADREANAPSAVEVDTSSERKVEPPRTAPGKANNKPEPIVRASDSDLRSAMTVQAPGDQSDPIVGRHVMDWRVSHRFGEGGMGTVYLALHKKMGERRKKIVKVLPVDATPADKERFWREAEVAADVGGDERVVQIDTYDQWPDGRAYILMEFIDGPTLQQEIARSAPFGEEKALKQVGLRIVDTMAMLHAAKIIHRDLKPSNIMLPPKRGGGFRVKLIDFGVAKPPASLDRYGTDRRIACGTPGYWSPEAASAVEVDARSDVFSLGVILFEMLAGVLPFPVDGDMMAALTELLTAPAPSINSIRARKGLPPVAAEVEDLVARCLARKRQERPWMADVHKQLNEVIARLGAEGVVRTPMATMRSVAPPELIDQLPRPASASQEAIAEMSDMLDRVQSVPPTPAKTVGGRLVRSVAASSEPIRASSGPNVGRPASIRRTLIFVIGALVVASAVAAGTVTMARRRAALAPVITPVQVERAVSASPPQTSNVEPVKRGHVRIVTLPPGANLMVDGRSLGRTPMEVTGTIDALTRVRLDLPGYLSRSEDVMPTEEGGEAVFTLQRPDATRSTSKAKQRHSIRPAAQPKTQEPQPAADGIFD